MQHLYRIINSTVFKKVDVLYKNMVIPYIVEPLIAIHHCQKALGNFFL